MVRPAAALVSPVERSAPHLAAAIRACEVSCVEVMAAFLDRIEAVNPTVNAIVSLRDRDALLAEARAADEAGTRGPLHGLPFAIKDLVNTAGLTTTFGASPLADNVPPRDDMLAARIRAAGAIVVGKTNTPEFGLGSHTTNPVFGPTRNPFDTARSAGGSSGGAAAALACNMLPLADGSDMMGSLRNPAAWNGVYGFRPSIGMVPNDAMGTVDDGVGAILSTCGPMGRSPADMALLMDVIARSDERQSNDLSRPTSWLAALDGDAAPRVGWLGDWNGALPFESGILEFCERALPTFETIGGTVEAVQPDVPLADAWQAWLVLRSQATRKRLGPLVQRFGLDAMAPNVRAEFDMPWGDPQDTRIALERRKGFLASLHDLFERFDVLVLPCAQVWPFPVEWRHPTQIAGREMDTYHRWMEVVVPVSLTGLPAVALPCGMSENGLPMGVQAFARRGEDAMLLRLAARWHEAVGPLAKPSL